MPYSYSQISTYLRCPRQYEYASVKKLPRPMSPGESFGSSLHNTLRKFGLLELAHQKPPERKQLMLFVNDHHDAKPPDLSITTLLGLWRESFIAEGYESKEAMRERLADGEEALKEFHTWWSNERRDVLAVEKGFTLDIGGGITLAGRFDRVERTEKGLRIIDFKSTGPRSVAALRTDLQLSLYALAAGRIWQDPVAELVILCIQKKGVTEQRTTRSASDIDAAIRAVSGAAGNINVRDFTATPSPETCGHCPFRDMCSFRSPLTSAGVSGG